MKNQDTVIYDINQIEADARRLRAEMVREGAGRLRAWAKSRFAAHSIRHAHSA